MSAETSAFAQTGNHITRRPLPALLHAAIPGIAVFATALLGIGLRAHDGALSAFWAPNAVLLGLMLRHPKFTTLPTWIMAVAGFILADLLAGSDMLRTLLLTTGNMVGIVAGWLALRRADSDDLALRKTSSALVVAAGTAVAAFAAGLVGSVIGVILFDSKPLNAFVYWLVTEFANYIAILPVILTATIIPVAAWRPRIAAILGDWRKSVPVLVAVTGLALVPVLGGRGALTFAVPGLLWCALSYSVASTALLTFLFATWTFITLTTGLFPLSQTLSEHDLISLRLGVTLVALAPITVATVMSARNEMLRQTAAARAAAEDAMASRSLLLATMTHELRSPLGAMIGLADVMARESHGAMGDPRYPDYARSIAQSGRHLNALVTDLLDTAKVEAGRIELAKAPYSSGALVEQSLCLVRGLAMDARVSITTLPGEWPDVYVDSRAIKQVLINLVSNAIKFSSKGATVTISCECDEARATVRVMDTGTGIAPAELKLLGQAWAQAGEATARRQGTGLGLALSIQLVAQHGGTLRLESMPGAGTTAIFSLPRDI